MARFMIMTAITIMDTGMPTTIIRAMDTGITGTAMGMHMVMVTSTHRKISAPPLQSGSSSTAAS